MDVVTRAEGETGPEAHRPDATSDAAAAEATLYQDVVLLYRLVPGAAMAMAMAMAMQHGVSDLVLIDTRRGFWVLEVPPTQVAATTRPQTAP